MNQRAKARRAPHACGRSITRGSLLKKLRKTFVKGVIYWVIVSFSLYPAPANTRSNAKLIGDPLIFDPFM